MSACAGDWVEVRSREEILATLDKDGRLDGMPFMPEMFEYCGRRMRVHKRAHKGCDTINPVSSRALPRSVLLEGVRCSGAAHGGCEAQCSVFWKEAWLEPVGEGAGAPRLAPPAATGAGCTEADVVAAARNGATPSGKPRWRCQATDFPAYTTKLRTMNISQFWEDLESRNVTPGVMLMTAVYFLFDFVFKPEWSRHGAPFRWLYDKVQALWGGMPYPRRHGVLDSDADAPVHELGLQPGELVRVKPMDQILATLSKGNFHRGMFLDGESLPYCGGVYRVRSRVGKFLDEKTGVMRTMKTPAVILENVWCRSRISNGRILCPRAIYPWWREAWLERAPDASAPSSATALGARAYLADLVREEREQARGGRTEGRAEGGTEAGGAGAPAGAVKEAAS